MVAYNLDQAALDSLLASENYDPHIRKAIIDYLVETGSSTENALQFVGGLNAAAPNAAPTALWSTVAGGLGSTGDLQFGGIGQFHDTLFSGAGNYATLPGGSYNVQSTASGVSIVGSSGDDTFLARAGH